MHPRLHPLGNGRCRGRTFAITLIVLSVNLVVHVRQMRPHFPDVYHKIYAEHYKSNREGTSAASSVAQRMESWMHRKVATDVAHRAGDWTTLEIGAGNLNHLRYEPKSARYDVVESLVELVEKSSARSRVTNVYSNL